MHKIVLFFITILGVTSCFDAPEFSSIPNITSVEWIVAQEISSPTVATELRIFFEDGEGDFGYREDETAKSSIYLSNNKLGFVDSNFFFPFIPSRGSVSDISGNVQITVQKPGEPTGLIASTCFFTVSQGKLDTLSYDLQIRDRAGNLSNIVTSPPLIIDCR